jgi:hypothetical protein
MRSAQPRRLAFPSLGCRCNWASRRLALQCDYCLSSSAAVARPIMCVAGAGTRCTREARGRAVHTPRGRWRRPRVPGAVRSGARPAHAGRVRQVDRGRGPRAVESEPGTPGSSLLADRARRRDTRIVLDVPQALRPCERAAVSVRGEPSTCRARSGGSRPLIGRVAWWRPVGVAAEPACQPLVDRRIRPDRHLRAEGPVWPAELGPEQLA